MADRQHTLGGPVTVSGTGLHTGKPCTLTIRPADVGFGFRFRRVDLQGHPTVPAHLDFVTDSHRATTLANGEAQVQLVEHVLAALAGFQVDNALIELDSVEPPILDGSALPFLDLLSKAGRQVQPAHRAYWVIDKPLELNDPDKKARFTASPANTLELNVEVDFSDFGQTPQRVQLGKLPEFGQHFAPARTFCFLNELEALHQAGLIRGGSLDNAVVLVDRELNQADRERLAGLFGRPNIDYNGNGVLNNTQLRFPDEPARHKLLDLLGDLQLLGYPLLANISAHRPGHSSNLLLARALHQAGKLPSLFRRFQPDPQPGVVFDINAIHQILPHRYPFLLVDKITHFDEESIEGVKNVTMNEQFFQGHFPHNPIMPGVLIIEAMAQVGGIHLTKEVDHPQNYWTYFVSIDDCRFRRPVVPGDVLHYRLERQTFRRGICKLRGVASVNGHVAAEATITASLIRKPNT